MRILVTGGAGFVGTNVASHFASEGHQVVVLDNLSRRGVAANRDWLLRHHPSIEFIEGDIRDPQAVARVVRGADRVFHLAAQVAVTTSVTDPQSDFEINLTGTFNMLEALRQHAPRATFFFTSTNKVYGGLEDLNVVRQGERYAFETQPEGVSEERVLDFHSPYGCSKGAADQYVRDYARIYGLKTVVFRMSCIYGPHQCGNEDQGWVAHFAREALAGGGLSIFGDGRQVRDILYVQDLVRAFAAAAEASDVTAGQIYNIGGGPENAISLLELISELEEITGRTIRTTFQDWRPGDQRIYVTNVSRAYREFGWRPEISKRAGLRQLVEFLRAGSEAAASVSG